MQKSNNRQIKKLIIKPITMPLSITKIMTFGRKKVRKLTRNGDRSQPHTYLIACPQVMYRVKAKVTDETLFSTTQPGFSQDSYTYQSSVRFPFSNYQRHSHFRTR